jgi:predicted oxidoreductase
VSLASGLSAFGSSATELEADAIIIGGGLAGLVATAELAAAGKRVLVLEQEPPASLGGQAYWSLGGLFLVDSPEQRRARVHDCFDLAWSDWLASAQFDRPEDERPKRFARAYVEFATADQRDWLRSLGVRLLPSPGWAERGGDASSAGNSVPRFHLAWGTGPGLLEPFERQVRAAAAHGRVKLAFRHRVDELTVQDGRVVGVAGAVLARSLVARGQESSREVVGRFTARAGAVLVASGGIGGNLDLVRRYWPERLGAPPADMVVGVPPSTDGRMLAIAEGAGASWIGRDRMWHYTEGVRNWAPVWENHGIRILPGPSSLWLDATGRRLPAPLFPGFDTVATLGHIGRSGRSHTWFVLNQRIVAREFALSGSEQNPDITGKSVEAALRTRLLPEVPGPVQAFLDQGEDFVVAGDLRALVAGMNRLTPEPLLDHDLIERQIVARDREVANPYGKDLQLMAIRNARRYLPDRVSRVVAPHRILDPEAGPLIAVKLHVLTRKTLGGLETDLEARVLGPGGAVLPGLWAAGEAAGFGGGGMHGYSALEGTFLGGCMFSGREAGRSIARDV